MPMLSNSTEARQGRVRTIPCTEAGSDRSDDVAQFRKVLVVETAAANQFPDPFDGIEFRTVRRQEVEDKMAGNFLTPLFVQTGVVVASIVDDHGNFSAAVFCDAFHPSIERPAGRTTNIPIGWHLTSLPIPRATRTKVPKPLTSGGIKPD